MMLCSTNFSLHTWASDNTVPLSRSYLLTRRDLGPAQIMTTSRGRRAGHNWRQRDRLSHALQVHKSREPWCSFPIISVVPAPRVSPQYISGDSAGIFFSCLGFFRLDSKKPHVAFLADGRMTKKGVLILLISLSAYRAQHQG